MKKRLIALILTAALVVLSVAALAACGPKNSETELNVVCLNKGYGKEWIEDIAAKFEADHPGYTVNLQATASASTLISRNITSRNNVDDVYISVGADWLKYARQGLFANLDDIMNDEIDGVTLKNKVSSEYQNSILYPDRTGALHTYRLPWVAATGGIFYNQKMFEEQGWEVPTTYEELVTLCQTIIDSAVDVPSSDGGLKTVAPFVYTSANPDYFDYTVYTWWAQLAGEEAIREFTLYKSADNYDVTKSDTYRKLQTATEMWYDLFKNPANVTVGVSNDDAQLKFAKGEAAMMFSGDWMYNEIANYDLNSDKFELGIMKTPAANGAVDPDILYTIGEDQYIAIPESSIKKDLAKDFVKLIVSDYGCKTFLNKAHGLLAYNCDYTNATTDKFMNNLIETRNSYTTRFTDYPTMPKDGSTENVLTSTRMLYLAGSLTFWSQASLRPYGDLLNVKGYTIETAFATIATETANSWAQNMSNLGLK